MLLIKNGFVKTMGPSGDIPDCDVLIENGKIKEVAKNIKAPEDCEIVDAAGYTVCPGFVEAHCHVGLFLESAGAVGSDGNERTDPVTPQIRAVDGIDPMDEGFRDALEGGVTTVVTGPGSANVIGGQFAAVKTCGKRIDDMIVKAPAAMKIAFGENPKRVYGEKGKTPTTRMAVASILRDTLTKAQIYLAKKEKAQNEGTEPPAYDAKMEALIPVLKREIPLKAHAHRADDIFTAIRIANEFNLRLTLDHCTEGHLIADDLAKEGRGCLVGPSLSRRSKLELKNRTFETPAVLYKKGLKVGIITDAPIIPQQYLPVCAGLAVKAGLPEEEAWKAITINNAQIVGIDDMVGSLEEGKDGDVVLWEGNPIRDIQAKVKLVAVRGKIEYKA